MAETDPTIAAGAQSPATTMAPGGVDPAMMAQMISGIQQQGGGAAGAPPPPATGQMGGVLPPSSPVAQPPQAGGMADYGALAQQQVQNLVGSAPAQEATGARGQASQLAQQAAGMPLPKTGPQIEKGKGFLHNLGQALLLASEVTGAGRNLNQAIYEPGERQYAQKQAGYAEQIKALQSQAAGAEAETGSLAQVAGRTIYGGAQVAKGQMTAQQMQQRTQEMATAATQRYQGEIARITGEKDVAKMQADARILAQKMRDDTEVQTRQMQDVTAEDVTSLKDQTGESIANLLAAKDLNLKAAFMEGWMGMGTPQTPGGAAPVTGNVPARGAAPAQSGATKPAYKGPDGSWYSDPQFKTKIK